MKLHWMSEQNGGYDQIPNEEKTNLSILARAITSNAIQNSAIVTGYLVGGSLKYEWPRDDLDVAVVFENEPPNVTSEGKSHYNYCLDSYRFFERVIVNSVSNLNGWLIINKIEPAKDYEFGDQESILRHDGSIIVKPNVGTQIELIHVLRKGIKNFEKNNKDPFIKL